MDGGDGFPPETGLPFRRATSDSNYSQHQDMVAFLLAELLEVSVTHRRSTAKTSNRIGRTLQWCPPVD